MSKRMWTGLVAGLLAALALVAVGVGAYRAGQDHEVAVTTVPAATGEVVRVVGDGHWRGGPPFGFLIPLLIIGLIVVLVAGRRRALFGPAWGGPGWGACGPCGPAGPAGRDAMLADWHRRAHTETAPPAPADPPPAGPGGTTPGPA